MGLFSSGSSDVRYGAIVDIGSGSVLVSIVRSNVNKQHPEIIWTKREYVLLKDSISLEQSAKNILTALINAILLLGNEGLKTLKDFDSGAKLGTMQISISAPWSYTITKTVNYEDDDGFEITRSLITQLTEAAQKKTLEELKENEITELLGLEVIARTTTDLIANGYRTDEPYGQMVKQLSLAHVSAVAQLDLIDAVRDAKEKVIPSADIAKYSFMLVYYCVIRELYPSASEFCLVDVTYEATEIAIIRDGILRFSTHIPYGSYTLARAISRALNIPKEEAFTYLKDENITATLEALPEAKQQVLQSVLKEYQEQITELLKQTGDTLSIPKTVFLHTDLYTEHFFKTQMIAATTAATHGGHIIHEVTNEILTAKYKEDEKMAIEKARFDTALLLSAQFFHKQHRCGDFEQL